MHGMPCGLALALKVFIKCVEAGLNLLGLSIFAYADGWFYSVGKAQICIHSDYKVFEREARLCRTHTVSWDNKFSLSPFHRWCSSLIKHLTQCGPTALVFSDVPLVLLKLGNFRAMLQPNICVLTLQVLIFTSTRIFTYYLKWPTRKAQTVWGSQCGATVDSGADHLHRGNTPCGLEQLKAGKWV